MALSTTALVTDSVINLKEDIIQNTDSGNEKSFLKLNIKEKLFYIKELVTIEPVLCCYLIASVLCNPALNNVQLEMACKANSRFNDSVCNAVITATHAENNFTEQNSAVQQHISDMLSWSIPVQSIVPVILLLFFGSYSDRHKIRKPFLLIPVFGEILTSFLYIICTIFRHKWPVAAMGIAYTLSSFSGSSAMITMSAFAFIADVSTQEMRIVRISVIQICLSVCIPIALTFSGVLFDAIGYIPSLLVGLLLYTIAFLYGIFIVKEPKQSIEIISIKSLITDIVNPQHAMETLKLLTHAKGSQRTNVIFIFVIIYITATVVGGEEYVFFYFVQHTYGWDYSHYTIFLSVWTVANSVGLGLGVLIFTKVFHLDDLITIALSFLSKIAANIIFISVLPSYGLYIGLIAGIFQDVAVAGTRSLSTKYVSEDDIGKSQSLLSIVEAIGYALAAEIYHLGIYTYTRDTYIRAFFYVGIILYTLGIAILMWKYLTEKKHQSIEENANNHGSEMKNQKSDIHVE